MIFNHFLELLSQYSALNINSGYLFELCTFDV